MEATGPQTKLAWFRYITMQVNSYISVWYVYVLIAVAFASNYYSVLRLPAIVAFGIVLVSLVGNLCKSAQQIDEYGNLDW